MFGEARTFGQMVLEIKSALSTLYANGVTASYGPFKDSYTGVYHYNGAVAAWYYAHSAYRPFRFSVHPGAGHDKSLHEALTVHGWSRTSTYGTPKNSEFLAQSVVTVIKSVPELERADRLATLDPAAWVALDRDEFGKGAQLFIAFMHGWLADSVTNGLHERYSF